MQRSDTNTVLPPIRPEWVILGEMQFEGAAVVSIGPHVALYS
jgi:hypothetical protein